jgi:hypothetical protein
MKEKKFSISKSDAVFLGWQETISGGYFALYVVTVAGHPYHGSSVSEHTLNKLNMQVPEIRSSDCKRIGHAKQRQTIGIK